MTDAPLTSADFYHNGSTLAVGSATGLYPGSHNSYLDPNECHDKMN